MHVCKMVRATQLMGFILSCWCIPKVDFQCDGGNYTMQGKRRKPFPLERNLRLIRGGAPQFCFSGGLQAAPGVGLMFDVSSCSDLTLPPPWQGTHFS